MIRKTIYIVLISIIPLIAHSQVKMSKQEIYQYWIKTSKDLDKVNNYKTRFDSVVVKFIDNLTTSGIDSIGAYSLDYVGTISLDSCACGTIYQIAYVQWIKNGKTYHQKVTKCCSFKPIIIGSSVLIRYYINSKSNIDKERIMPVITFMSRNNKGGFVIGNETIDHTTHYSIYCNLSGHAKFTTFEEYELENKNNIFFEDNVNSSITSWRNMIDNQIKEIER